MFNNLECIFGDPMHIVFRIDLATGAVVKTLVSKVKKCVAKLKHGTADATPFYSKGDALPQARACSQPTYRIEASCLNALRLESKGEPNICSALQPACRSCC